MLIKTNNKKDYAEMRKPWVKGRSRVVNGVRMLVSGVMTVTEEIAAKMPELDLPRMEGKTRAAFQDMLDYERPTGNGWMKEILLLAQARGYCAHPCDWVPSSESDHQFPELYTPWANWLASEGYTPYYSGVPLTAQNWDCWTPNARRYAFRYQRGRDPAAADDLLMTVGVKKPAASRLDLVKVIGAGGDFYGLYPHDIPTMRFFLNDRSAKVRAVAARKLDATKGLETKLDHAKVLAEYFRVRGNGLFSKLRGRKGPPKIVVSKNIHHSLLTRHALSTDLDTVAEVLGITVRDIISGIDIKQFRDNLYPLLMRTKDKDARKILARRAAEGGEDCSEFLFRDVEPELWKKGLNANLVMYYGLQVSSYLGTKKGTLDIETVRKMACYADMIPSVTREIETGKLPVNTIYDPLRILAMVASKDAARALLEETYAAGIAKDNPRLTTLKFNAAL